MVMIPRTMLRLMLIGITLSMFSVVIPSEFGMFAAAINSSSSGFSSNNDCGNFKVGWEDEGDDDEDDDDDGMKVSMSFDLLSSMSIFTELGSVALIAIPACMLSVPGLLPRAFLCSRILVSIPEPFFSGKKSWTNSGAPQMIPWKMRFLAVELRLVSLMKYEATQMAMAAAIMHRQGTLCARERRIRNDTVLLDSL